MADIIVGIVAAAIILAAIAGTILRKKKGGGCCDGSCGRDCCEACKYRNGK